MIEERVCQGPFKPAWGPYRNAHFLVPTKNRNYHFIICAVSTNQHTLELTRIPPNVEEFSTAFAALRIALLIVFPSRYNQKMLHKDSRDNMAFLTMQGMYRPTILVQGATNSVSVFVTVSRKTLNAHHGSIAKTFVHNVGVKGSKSRYREEEVEGLPGVRRVVMEHLQNLYNILADVERATATVSGEQSDWYSNGVKIVGFIYGEVGRWPQASKVDKLWNWP